MTTKLELRLYQRQAIDAVYNYFRAGNTGNPVIVAPTGCHASGTMIMLADGRSKAVEDIVIGDLLMGPDSAPRTVLRLARGRQMLYRITPKSGEPFIVNEDHILALKRTSEGKGSQLDGTLSFVSVKDYLQKTKTFKHIRKLHRVSVEFPQTRDPIIPGWVVGAMLGDGTLCNSVPSFSKPLGTVTDRLIAYVRSLGCDVSITHKEGTDCKTIWINDPRANRSHENAFRALLKAVGIYGQKAATKFIPDDYLYGSRQTRLDTLAGLLDTDGHISSGVFDFISKSERLALGVQFLARSVGLAANVKQCVKRCQNDFEGTYWRVCISGDLSIIPTCQKIAGKRLQKKNVLVTGFDIEPVGEGDFYGFELDGDHLYLTSDFIVHHNSGKSLILAKFIEEVLRQWPDQRILLLAHRKELLQQNLEKLLAFYPNAPVGVYSAGLKQRQLGYSVTIAGIASVHNKARQIGWTDLVIIDEAHLLSNDEDTMYRKLIQELSEINPKVKVIGLTATPYRMKTGMLTDKGGIFTDIAYDIELGRLVKEGYLCPLVSKIPKTQADLSSVKVRGGEFVAADAERAMDIDELTEAAIDEMDLYLSDRSSWIVFCSGVEHAKHVSAALNSRGHEAEFIVGETDDIFRAATLRRFKEGKLKCLVNCDVLTTGFDAPNIDAIVLLRPTKSVGLYVQMLGRGSRLSPGKQTCIVLDFAGNIERHGPVDCVRIQRRAGGEGKEVTTAPVKTCPDCGTAIAISVMVCPTCGYEFPTKQAHDVVATTKSVMMTLEPPQRWRVMGVEYKKHVKPDKAPSLRVTYQCEGDGNLQRKKVSEWVCLEHRGFAHQKAVKWWLDSHRDHKMPEIISIPRTIDQALDETRDLRPVLEIVVQNDGKFDRVVSRTLGDFVETKELNPWDIGYEDMPFVDDGDDPHI